MLHPCYLHLLGGSGEVGRVVKDLPAEVGAGIVAKIEHISTPQELARERWP